MQIWLELHAVLAADQSFAFSDMGFDMSNANPARERNFPGMKTQRPEAQRTKIATFETQYQVASQYSFQCL